MSIIHEEGVVTRPGLNRFGRSCWNRSSRGFNRIASWVMASMLLLASSACKESREPPASSERVGPVERADDTGSCAATDVPCRARRFLISQLDDGRYDLVCRASDGSPCPVHGTGHVFTAFFLVDALGSDFPDEARRKLLARISSEDRNGTWGYAENAPVDSDDTAFVLRTLFRLNEPVSIEGLLSFASPAGFHTFRWSRGGKPPELAFRPSRSNNAALHPEVNANIYTLFHEIGRSELIDFRLIESGQAPEGYWRSYFYPGNYYSTYMHLRLLCSAGEMKEAMAGGTSFLRGSQHADGSWGDPGNVYDTALALNSLDVCGEREGDAFKKGVAYLRSAQSPDGSLRHSQVIWEFRYRDAPAVTWRAYDDQGLVATALALKVLAPAAKSP
jgi:hypothetical protein